MKSILEFTKQEREVMEQEREAMKQDCETIGRNELIDNNNKWGESCVYGFRDERLDNKFDLELIDRFGRLRVFRHATNELFWMDDVGRLRTGLPPRANMLQHKKFLDKEQDRIYDRLLWLERMGIRK